MTRHDWKDLIDEDSDRENNVESLRLQLQRLLSSLQERNEIIKELWRKNNQYENDAKEFGSLIHT